MKYFPLVWAALCRRKTRTILTFLSILTAFFLYGALQGANVGINQALDLADTSHLVVMSRVNMSDPMPIAHATRIAALPGVVGVAPITALVGTYQRPTDVQVVLGTDISALFKINTLLKTPPAELAAAARTRDGVIVGRALATRMGWKIGDRIPIHSFNIIRTGGAADWVFDIVGIYDLPQKDWATRIWANYDYINEARAAGKNTAVQFYVGISDARQSARIAQSIDDLFSNSSDQTVTENEKDFLKSVMQQVGNINYLVNAIVGAVLFTLLFLTANTMGQSVHERIPDLAVLKTLGFTDAGVQSLVLAEALLLCILGAVSGLALATAVLPAVSSYPSAGIAAMHVPHIVFTTGLGLAVALALLSGVPPAWRARRLEVAAALSRRQ